jgi:hypothetical protein
LRRYRLVTRRGSDAIRGSRLAAIRRRAVRALTGCELEAGARHAICSTTFRGEDR